MIKCKTVYMIPLFDCHVCVFVHLKSQTFSTPICKLMCVDWELREIFYQALYKDSLKSFLSKTTEPTEPKLYMNNHCMELYQVCVVVPIRNPRWFTPQIQESVNNRVVFLLSQSVSILMISVWSFTKFYGFRWLEIQNGYHR